MKSIEDRFSDFWLSDRTQKKLDNEDKELSAIELAQAKRSIADFVRIMSRSHTRNRIPVEYQTEGEEQDHSYTDGEKVVIGADVREGFDATVGVALHESSHIVKSDFEMLDKFDTDGDCPLVPQEFIDKIEPLLEKSEEYEKIEEKLKSSVDGYDESELDPEEQAKRALHHFWNVVEDRWIDDWAYGEAPGYRGYYQKMYKKYWHSEDIAEQLQGDEARDLDWSSYSFRITNITNDARDLDALPGLREIWNILDVENINRHESSQECLETAKEIMRVVLENAEELYVHPSFGAGGGGDEDGEGVPYGDLPEDLQEMLEDQLDQMQGQAGSEIDQEKSDQVGTLEDAGVDTENVGEEMAEASQSDSTGQPLGRDHEMPGNTAQSAGIKCVVIESISEGMTEGQRDFPIIKTSTQRRSSKAVSSGMQKGRVLGNRLKIRDERRSTKHSRRRRGKLDSRMLAEITYSPNVFYTEQIEEYKDGFIHISVDASGSMNGEKFQEAMQTCVAISKAADMIENLRAQVSFRSTVKVGSEDRPLILVGYDSKRDPIQNIRRFFPYITASGTTPEGLCFEAVQDKILPATPNRDSYFVNLSDGKPHFYGGTGDSNIGYSGTAALDHTAREVRKMKKKGVHILGYYIGGNRRDGDFKRMYGNDAQFIDVNDITRIRRTMNEKFLEEDGKVNT